MRKSVFITRDTNFTCVEVRNAYVGIRKRHGCLYFTSAKLYGPYIKQLTKKDCIEKYGGHPKSSSAYLVEPKGKKDWKWTRVDHLMAFSTCADRQDSIPAKDILWL